MFGAGADVFPVAYYAVVDNSFCCCWGDEEEECGGEGGVHGFVVSLSVVCKEREGNVKDEGT